MKNQEKKYLVPNFEEVLNLLEAKGAKKGEEKISWHYYAELPNNDVVKLVCKADANEIHVLKETDGKFDLVEDVPVGSKEEGFKWLNEKGYKNVGVVKMVNTNYEYGSGDVGLYVINDWLYSVILDYPAGEHEKYEKEFGLENAEQLKLPYNKYLEEKGKLEKIETSKDVRSN